MKAYNLVFDCTVLGMGHFHPKAKTGVFRVTENLLQQFVSNPSVSVFFYTPEHPLDTYIYLTDNQVSFTNQQFLITKSGFAYLKLVSKLLTLFPKGSLFHKVFRRIAHFYRPQTSFDYFEKSKEKFNFLSPFYPINYPKSLKLKGKNFIIIHDVIPLIFPDLVEEGNIEVVKKVVASLDDSTVAVCVSASTQHDLKTFNPAPPSVVIPLAASAKTFYTVENKHIIHNALHKYSIPTSDYLLSVATLEPRKNIIRMLSAFELYKKENPNSNLKLVLAGTKGWALEDELAKLKINPNVQKDILFIGFVADSDLAALYSGAKAFVYPSLYEGFGLPVLEALQCGTPVLTSAISSLPEVVGKVGVYVNPLDIESIKNGIYEILSDAYQNEISKQHNVAQAQNFSWKNSMLKYLDIFCQKF